MPKGKPWSKEDELKLRELVEAGTPLKVIAAELGKSVNAIRQKIMRLGLEVEKQGRGVACSTTSKLDMARLKELPPVAEALKLLAIALKSASEPGLDMIEIQRLNTVATLARTYETLLARFMQYREIEKRLVELEAKYVRLAKQTEEKAG